MVKKKSNSISAPKAVKPFLGIKSVAKDTLLYGGASAISKSLTLITFPLFARHFSVDEFGEIDSLNTLAALLLTFIIMGQDSALVRFFHESDDVQERKELISQSLIFQLIFAFMVLPIIWIFSSKIGFLSSGSSNSGGFLKLIVFQMPFQIIISNSQALLQFTFKRAKFIFLTLGLSVATVSTLTISILIFKTDVISIFYINLCVSFFFALLSIFFIKNWLTLPKSFSKIKALIPYALPMGLIVSLASFQPYFERLIVTNLIGTQSLGLYAAGAKISLMIALPIGAFQAAWSPFMMSMFKQKDAIVTFNWLLKFLTLGLCVSVLISGAIAFPMLKILAGNEYTLAYVFVFPLSMGLVVQCIALFTGMGSIISNKTYYRLISYIAALLTSSIAIFFLIKIFGVIGIGLGVLVGQITKLVFESYFGQRLWPLNWHYKGVFIVLFVTVLLGIGILFFVEDKLTLICLYLASTPIIILIGWFYLFSKIERNRLCTFKLRSN